MMHSYDEWENRRLIADQQRAVPGSARSARWTGECCRPYMFCPVPM